MRRMETLQSMRLAGFVGLVCAVLGAAPAAPSYLGVERTIEAIRQSWSQPGRTAAAQPSGMGRPFRCRAK